MKKLIIALTVLVGIGLGVGTASAATAITSGAGNKVSQPPPGGTSGDIVVAWNQQLLQIVLTPGAQPATVHPTRSFAILHAAIYDSVVSITKDASPYLFSVPASRGARVDAAAAQAGHDTLAALYPNLNSKLQAGLDQLLAGELAAIPDGAGKQDGIKVGHDVAARLLAARANDGSAATPHLSLPATTRVISAQFRQASRRPYSPVGLTSRLLSLTPPTSFARSRKLR